MEERNEVKFNPIIPFMRLIWVIAAAAFLAKITHFTITHFQIDASRSIWMFLGGAPIAGYFLYVPMKGLINNTKIYTISSSHLTVTNLVRFGSETFSKEDVKGFSESEVPYRIGSFKQVIVYLRDGRKLEIMQFEHFNFKDIKPMMINCGYNYLGFEPYQWKWFDSRVYFFD